MKILAVVTARGGSKRLPGKNVRPLGGIPLLTWSINVASGIPEVCDILVSTDDPAIADIARDAGALVPWLRPAELATDDASSVDVCLHALDWYEAAHGAVDGLLLLQPTSPLRRRATLERGLDAFRAHGGRPVLGVSPPGNVVNGALYLISPEDLRRGRSFKSEDSVALVIADPEESIDIDTESDWQAAVAAVVSRGEAGHSIH